MGSGNNMRLTHEIAFWLGIILGSSLGILIGGLLSSNKIEGAWHNGFRAGKYGKGN